MILQTTKQWIRKVELLLADDKTILDLSQFHIRFRTQNADAESPNSCAIRVYNLSAKSVKSITLGEFNSVTLNAGYQGGNFGLIFKGTIKQFRFGKENATDTYLDIFASDGDIGYNQGLVNENIKKGLSVEVALNKVVESMPGTKLANTKPLVDAQHMIQLRGVVLFGMARARLRNYAKTLKTSWSIQDGKVTLIEDTGYLEGEVIKINVNTGLIGLPEQTNEGIRIQCLLNSRLSVGGAVELNNAEVVQLMQQDPDAAPAPYNQWAGFQFNAPLSPDGIYRAYVIEHEGDTRGTPWYSHLTCLAIDPSAAKDNSVKPSK